MLFNSLLDVLDSKIGQIVHLSPTKPALTQCSQKHFCIVATFGGKSEMTSNYMSKFKYAVDVVELKEIHEMPGAWTTEKYKELLRFLEYDELDNVATDELKDTAAMALLDFEPEEAAEELLEFIFGEDLNAGQRENIAVDARRESLWEQYSDIAFHEGMFNMGSMLYVAFPMKFREPDAVCITLKVKALNHDSEAHVQNPDEAFIARLLNDGMNEHNTIFRLFQDNLSGESFPEAEKFIWRFDAAGFNESDKSNTFTIYTSWNWVDELKSVDAYESTAYADEKNEEQ